MSSTLLLPRGPNPVHPALTSVTPAGQPAVSGSTTSLQQARQEFSRLEVWLASRHTLALPLHEVECAQEPKAREVQRWLLQSHIQQRGCGDVGPALRVKQGEQEDLYTHRRMHRRFLRTIVGRIEIARMSYGKLGAASIHPLDAALQLPARTFSYELQKRMVKAAVQGPFQEATERIQEISGVSVPKRSLEEVIQDAAQDFDAFYAARPLEPWTETGLMLVAAVDGKGIPLVKRPRAPRVVRLGKGQKINQKKMATVAAVFTRQPWVRTPEQVVDSLFACSPRPAVKPEVPPRPEHKRVWASLTKGKTAVIAEVAEEMRRRDPLGRKLHVALTDGERALQILVHQKLQGAHVIFILDFVHVLEKLWKAAYVFHAEGSPEAEQWVRLRALRILRGQVSQVVKGLRQSVTKRGLRAGNRKTVLSVAGYLYRNRTRMRYATYLAQGLPIATGVVEGACKHLIKDRMERSGMRWTEAMAESIVKLRAAYLSGDFDAYWQFHIKKDQERLHPPCQWSVVEK